jgi:hypothetical protein
MLSHHLTSEAERRRNHEASVDTSAITFLCAVEAEPVVDFETKRPRADENDEPLYVVQLIAMTDGAAEIIAVMATTEADMPDQQARQGERRVVAAA